MIKNQGHCQVDFFLSLNINHTLIEGWEWIKKKELLVYRTIKSWLFSMSIVLTSSVVIGPIKEHFLVKFKKRRDEYGRTFKLS